MPRQLPEFEKMLPNYFGEAVLADVVKSMIGGSVNQEHYKNTCVIRVSRSLNYAGHQLPRDNRNGFRTKQGADRFWYGLRVDEFWTWMLLTYGKPLISRKRPLDIADFNRYQGIIGFRMKFTTATGHFTLWNGFELLQHNNIDYWGQADEAALWTRDTTRSTLPPA